MIARSKRYKNSYNDDLAEVELPHAIERLSAFEKAKFDETVEISMSLGVDPKQSAQAVRGVVNLPHGSGKEIKVLVFTENAEEVKEFFRAQLNMREQVKWKKQDEAAKRIKKVEPEPPKREKVMRRPRQNKMEKLFNK